MFPAFPAHAQPVIYVSGKRTIEKLLLTLWSYWRGMFDNSTQAVINARAGEAIVSEASG